MNSVLQQWVMELPLREQGTLLTAIRGCDLAPKNWTEDGQPVETTERQLVAYIRWCVMNPADRREVDVPGAFFRSKPPVHVKVSALGHYPLHWYTHVMHTLEVIGYRHPFDETAKTAFGLYCKLVHNIHLMPESREQMITRLSEDRIASGEVVS